MNDVPYGRAALRPETVLNDYNSMYFLNVEECQNKKKNDKREEEEPITNLEWEVTESEKYENYVEFDKEVHKEIQKESYVELSKQVTKVSKSLKSSFMSYHQEINQFLKSYAGKFNELSTMTLSKPFYEEETIAVSEKKWCLESIPGREHPERWPEGLDKMIKRLLQLKFLALFSEESDLHRKMINQLQSFVKKTGKKLQKTTNKEKLKEFREGIAKGLTCLILLSLHFADFELWLNQIETIEFLIDTIKDEVSQEFICKFVTTKIVPLVVSIKTQVRSTVRLHSMADCTVENFFRITHLSIKEPLPAHQGSLASDKEYLYLIIATRQGGLYKIGTGNGLTKAGKVYEYIPISWNCEIVNWVCIDQHLYLSSNSLSFGSIKVFDKTTLKETGEIELDLEDLKAESLNMRINKAVKLVTDGKHLYCLAKKIRFDEPPKKESPLTDKQKILKQKEEFQNFKKKIEKEHGDLFTQKKGDKASTSVDKKMKKEIYALKRMKKKAVEALKARKEKIKSVKDGKKVENFEDENDDWAAERSNNSADDNWGEDPQPVKKGNWDNLSVEEPVKVKVVVAAVPDKVEVVIPAEKVKVASVKKATPVRKSKNKKWVKKQKKELKAKIAKKKAEIKRSKVPILKDISGPKSPKSPKIKREEIEKEIKESFKVPQSIKKSSIENPFAEYALQEDVIPQAVIEDVGMFYQENPNKPLEKTGRGGRGGRGRGDRGRGDRGRGRGGRGRGDRDRGDRSGLFERSEGGRKGPKPPSRRSSRKRKKKFKKKPNEFESSLKEQMYNKSKIPSQIVPPIEVGNFPQSGVLEFWLFKFDFTFNSKDQPSDKSIESNPLVLELYDSFNSLFTIKECAKAFVISDKDIELAAQWLIDEGEEARDKMRLNQVSKTLIGESEIDPNCLKTKSPKSIVVVSNSLLHENVFNSNCIIHERVLKIGNKFYFSIDKEDEYTLPETLDHILEKENENFVTPDRSSKALLKNLFEDDDNSRKEISRLKGLKELISEKHDPNELDKFQDYLAQLNETDDKRALLKDPDFLKMLAERESGKKESFKKKRPLRGTFICRWEQRENHSSGNCLLSYDNHSGLYYAMQVFDHQINFGAVQVFRDPISYKKSSIFDNKEDFGENLKKKYYNSIIETDFNFREDVDKVKKQEAEYYAQENKNFIQIKSLQELHEYFFQMSFGINRKRFALPWKPYDMLKAYHRRLESISNAKDIPASKKKKKKLHLNSKIKKLKNYGRKRKVMMDIEILEEQIKEDFPGKNKNYSMIEFKKSFAYCPTGNMGELQTIWNNLKGKISETTESIENSTRIWLEYFNLWVTHSSPNIDFTLSKEISSLLILILKDGKCEELRNYASCLLFSAFNLFLSSEKNQMIVFMIALNDYKKKIENGEITNQRHNKITEALNKVDYHCLRDPKSSLIEKMYVVFDSLGNCEDTLSFNFSRASLHINSVQKPDLLLIGNIGMLDQSLTKDHLLQFVNIMSDIVLSGKVTTETFIISKMYFKREITNWIRIESLKEDKEQNIHEFITRVMTVVDKISDRILEDNLINIHYTSMLSDMASSLISIVTSYLMSNKLHSGISKLEQWISKTLSLLKKFMKVFRLTEEKTGINISRILKGFNEGSEYIEEETLETTHPVNRNENINPKDIHFPGAIGVIVRLDKRCQVDQNSDILSLESWFSTHSNTNAHTCHINSNQNIHVGTNFQISGKPQLTSSIFMLGDCLNVSFKSSLKSRDEYRTISKWGIKATFVPIYGFNSTLNDNLVKNKVPQLLHPLIQSSVTILNRLSSTFVESLNPFLKGKNTSYSEKSLRSFLDWSMIKNGLSSLRMSKFFEKSNDGNLCLSPTMLMGLKKIQVNSTPTEGSTGETDQNSVTALTTASRVEYEKRVLEDERVSNILNRLQNSEDTIYDIIKKIKSFEPHPHLLRAEKRRPSFKTEIQKNWEKSENLIIIAILHHADLLKLFLGDEEEKMKAKLLLAQPNICEQLKSICHTKNRILNKMVSDAQIEREYTQLGQDLFDIVKEEQQNQIDEFEKKENEEKAKLDKGKKVNEGKNVKGKLNHLKSKYGAKKKKKRSDFTKKFKPKNKKDKKDKKKKKGKKEEKEVVKKEPKKTAKELEKEEKAEKYKFENVINPQVTDKLRDCIKDRLGGQMHVLKKILVSRNLEYLNDDPTKSFNNLLTFLLPFIKRMETEKNVIQGPYTTISNSIDERCFFLLKLATGFTYAHYEPKIDPDRSSAITEEEDLKPLGAKRSLSLAASTSKDKQKQINQSRDNLLDWLTNYQRWKRNRDQEEQDVTSENCSFLHSISTFLDRNIPINLKKLEKVMLRQAERACFRALGLNMIKEYLSFSGGTWLNKYISGVFSSTFKTNLFDRIEDLNIDIRQLLLRLAGNNAKFLMEKTIEDIEVMKVVNLSMIANCLQEIRDDKYDNRVDDLAEDFFRTAFVTFNELYSLIGNEHFSKNCSWYTENEELVTKFGANCIQLCLICLSLTELSSTHRALKSSIFLAEGIIKMILLILNEIVIPQNHEKFLTYLNKQVEKEIGLNSQNEYFLRIIYQLNDGIKSKRIAFLLNRIKDIIYHHRTDSSNKVYTTVAQNCMNILYLCSSPNLIKVSSSILDTIVDSNIEFKSITSVFERPLVFNMAKNQQALKMGYKKIGITGSRIADKLNVQKKICVLDYDKNQKMLGGKIQSSPMSLLFEKLGALVSQTNQTTKNEPKSRVKTGFHTAKTRNLWELIDCDEIKIKEGENDDCPGIISSNNVPSDSFVLLIHQTKEANFMNLFEALFYISRSTNLITLPKTFEEYQKEIKKTKSGDHGSKSSGDPGQATKDSSFIKSSYYSIYEQGLMNIPDFNHIDFKDDQDLPIGWFINLIGSHKDGQILTKDKKFSDRRSLVKLWQYSSLNSTLSFLKERLLELKVPKEDSTKEVKDEFIKEHNFYHKLIWLLKETIGLVKTLNSYGFALLPFRLAKRKAEEYAYIFDAAINSRTKRVKLQYDKPVIDVPPVEKKSDDDDKKDDKSKEKKTESKTEVKKDEKKKEEKKVEEKKVEEVKPEEKKKEEKKKEEKKAEEVKPEEKKVEVVKLDEKKEEEKPDEKKVEELKKEEEKKKTEELKKEEEKKVVKIEMEKKGEKKDEKTDKEKPEKSEKKVPSRGPLDPIEGMTVAICNFNLYQKLKKLIKKAIGLNANNKTFLSELNHVNFLYTSLMTGPVQSFYISRVSQMIRKIFEENSNGDIATEITNIIEASIDILSQKNMDEIEEHERNLIFGSLALLNGWGGSTLTGTGVKKRDDINPSDFVVIKSPIESGKLETMIIAPNDSNIASQSCEFEDLVHNEKYFSRIRTLIDPKKALSSLRRAHKNLKEMKNKPLQIEVLDCSFKIKEYHSKRLYIQIIHSMIFDLVKNTGAIKDHVGEEDMAVLKEAAMQSVGSDPETCRNKFYKVWEELADKFGKLTNLYTMPQIYNNIPALDDILQCTRKESVKMLDLKGIEKEDPSEFILPASSYSEALPRSNPKAINYSMLLHWENHIIPKIQNYVRDSFSNLLMMEFFERLRQPVRVSDHVKATGIAYRLCDWGLPPNTIIPSADHDWNTIGLQNIRVGSLVSIKTRYKGSLVSPAMKSFDHVGVTEVLAKVIQIDFQMSTLQVMIKNHNRMNTFTIWVHQQNVLPIELPIYAQGEDFPYNYLMQRMDVAHKKYTTHVARLILSNNFSPANFFKEGLRPYSQIKWTVIDQLSHNLINGWLNYKSPFANEVNEGDFVVDIDEEDNTVLHQLEEEVLELVKDPQMLKSIIQDIEKESEEIQKLLSNNNILMNLKKNNKELLDSQTKVSPLNLFEMRGAAKNSLCAIAITFKKSAFLGVASGIKFYSDKKGVRMVNHIFNSQRDKQIKKIPPILMNNTELYYEFYHHENGANPGQRHNFPSDLPCVVYGIPYSWTSCCWMINTVSIMLTNLELKNSDDFNQFCSLIKISVGLAQKISGPNIIKQMVYKLIIRLVRRLASLIKKCHKKLPNLFKKSSDELLKDIYGLEKGYLDSILSNEDLLKPVVGTKAEDFPFYSSYTQDILEMVATILTPIETPSGDIVIQYELPERIQAIVTLSHLCDHFAYGKKLKPIIKADIKERLFISYQTRNFAILKNLPKLKADIMKEIIFETLKKRKGILRSKKLDLHLVTDAQDMCEGKGVIFIEGWRPPVSEEDITASIDEPDNAPPPAAYAEWGCPACTFINSAASANCNICGSTKPEVEEPEVEVTTEKRDLEADRLKYFGYDLELAFQAHCDKINSAKSKEIEKEQADYMKSKPKNAKKEDIEKKMNEIEKAFIPLTVDKIKLVKIMKDGQRNEEGDEALLMRIVSEEFQFNLDKILEKEYEEKKAELDKKYESTTVDTLKEKFKDTTPWNLIDRLEYLGYDFWLEKVTREWKEEDDLSMHKLNTLISLIQADFCNSRSNAIHYSPLNLRFLEYSPCLSKIAEEADNEKTLLNSEIEDSVNYEKTGGASQKLNSLLNKCDLYALRYNWAKLLKFNELVHQIIPFINMGKENQIYHKNEYLSFGCGIAQLRNLILIDTKSHLETEIMKKTALSRGPTPKVTIARLKMADELEKRTESEKGETNLAHLKNKYVFLTAFDQLREIPSTSLRPVKPSGSDAFVAFEVVFKGEMVQGQAGPYRQFFADISAELQPSIISNDKSTLNLLIPTPNNKHDIGDFKDKFMINPDANSAYHLQLFQVLGLLMGCSLRTHTHLTLDLPSIFWKSLANEKLTKEDLEEVDKPLMELIKFMKNCKEEDFEHTIYEHFNYTLSNERAVELIPGGTDKKVTFENKQEFIDKVIQLRLNESVKQLNAIKTGLTKLIPQPFLSSMPSTDLALWICGRNEVNFEMLRRHTKYSGFEATDKIIENFWTVCYTMKPSDKLRFIKFCWGQVRLPASDEEYEKTQTRLMIKKSTSENNHDQMFPKADTCFFNFELPNYSTLSIMKEKILIAINLDCDSMNAENEFNDLENENGRMNEYED